MLKEEFRVKRKVENFTLKGLFFLVMIILSLLCVLLPFFYDVPEEYKSAIIGVGAFSFVYFMSRFVRLIYLGFRPKDALILTEEGFHNYIDNPKKGVFVNWSNVSSVKIFGPEKALMIGVELFDIEILSELLKKSKSKELKANVETGLPAIIIKQAEIVPRLSLILPAFNDYIDETKPLKLSKKEEAQKSTEKINNSTNVPFFEQGGEFFILPSEVPEHTVVGDSYYDEDIIVFTENNSFIPLSTQDNLNGKKDTVVTELESANIKQSEAKDSNISEVKQEPGMLSSDKTDAVNELEKTKEVPPLPTSAKQEETMSEITKKSSERIETLEQLLAEFSISSNNEDETNK